MQLTKTINTKSNRIGSDSQIRSFKQNRGPLHPMKTHFLFNINCCKYSYNLFYISRAIRIQQNRLCHLNHRTKFLILLSNVNVFTLKRKLYWWHSY